jgi:hypothetical protein
MESAETSMETSGKADRVHDFGQGQISKGLG